MEYIYGNLFGITQIIIGYPFDTIKTCLQNNRDINYFLRKPLLLYHGIRYPLFMNCIGTGVMFGNYDYINKQINNKILSGMLTGFIGSFIITPFDYMKINSQIFLKNEKNNNPRYNLIFKGLNYTICREIISIPCYFSTYDYLYSNYNSKEIFLNPFVFGGISGMMSWLCTYPIDTLKTRKQIEPHKTLKQIYNIGGLFNGLSITLLRAFIVNGFSFYVYDKIKF